MAPTKRKRRTKHRGNAAGVVEVRGRTGKPAAGAPAKRSGRGNPAAGRGARGAGGLPLKPPTWPSAALKALFGVAVLFVFFRFVGRQNTTSQALTLCAVAFVLYVPVMYMTDGFIYRRKLAKQQTAKR